VRALHGSQGRGGSQQGEEGSEDAHGEAVMAVRLSAEEAAMASGNPPVYIILAMILLTLAVESPTRSYSSGR
jgi:hypothetical protein